MTKFSYIQKLRNNFLTPSKDKIMNISGYQERKALETMTKFSYIYKLRTKFWSVHMGTHLKNRIMNISGYQERKASETVTIFSYI